MNVQRVHAPVDPQQENFNRKMDNNLTLIFVASTYTAFTSCCTMVFLSQNHESWSYGQAFRRNVVIIPVATVYVLSCAASLVTGLVGCLKCGRRVLVDEA